MAKIKGGDMMLFVDNKSIAYATNHTLEINGDLADTSNKDNGGGDWSSQEVNLLSFTASSENLYSLDGEGDNFEDLYDIMVSKTPVDAIFTKKSQSATDVPTGGWTPLAASGYKGKVLVTSLQLNAPNGDYATYTVQFQGVGALEKVKV